MGPIIQEEGQISKLIIAPMNSRNLDYMDFKQWVQGSRREESYQNVVYWPQISVYPGFLLSQYKQVLNF